MVPSCGVGCGDCPRLDPLWKMVAGIYGRGAALVVDCARSPKLCDTKFVRKYKTMSESGKVAPVVQAWTGSTFVLYVDT